jgi:hypothetical protein
MKSLPSVDKERSWMKHTFKGFWCWKKIKDDSNKGKKIEKREKETK